jgi:alpha,alpha-trehalase
MLAWQGLIDYGFDDVAHRLIYRWLYTITRNAADYNGTLPEKFDVVNRSHRVFAEYGNVGTEFSYITREGFGWMNASYQVGLKLLPSALRTELQQLVPPEWVFSRGSNVVVGFGSAGVKKVNRWSGANQ